MKNVIPVPACVGINCGGNPGVNSMMYIGVTSNMVKRMHERKEGLLEGFTKKYKVKDLVYTEWIPAFAGMTVR